MAMVLKLRNWLRYVPIILDSKTKFIKFNGTQILTSELMKEMIVLIIVGR